MTILNSTLLNLTGILIEGVGVAIFTYDVLKANQETVNQIAASSKLKSVNLEADAILVCDDGTPIQFLNSRLAHPIDEIGVIALMKKRRILLFGSILLFIGLAFQFSSPLVSK